MKKSILIPILFVLLTIMVVPLIPAYAECEPTETPQPCFDNFMVSPEPLTETSIMESFTASLEVNYENWEMSDRNWPQEDIGLVQPSIICTEFVVDGVTEYRMAKWVDTYKISSFEDFRDDGMCHKWLAPAIPDNSTKFTIELDKETYKTGETIKLSANVGVKESDSLATVTLFKPDGIVVTSIQIMPDDEGIVSYHFKAGSGNMDVSGNYTFEITYEYANISDHDIQTEYYTQSVIKLFSFNVIEDRTVIPISVDNDAPFFGIFVHIDNLFSWIMGK